jgi:cytochrome c oxidase subunit III
MFDPHLELGEGLRVPALELFYAFYFVMTGLHALHMVIGIGVLAVIAAQSWWIAAQRLSTRVENSGLYWHFVDLVWVFLFPMLYLIDRT